MTPMWKWMLAVGADEVAAVLQALPQDVKRRAEAVPIVFEKRPSRALVADGIEEDTLGLFLGPSSLDDPGASPLPAQVILFLENIRDAAGGEERPYRKEIRKTLLHELGHSLGWEEAEVAARHLD
ncbi:MAG: metallopeptidase family protein [Kiritimatiellae bacterium]|nr:metallopeptidase family protein [Verrucomicrobiota bacterium]MBU4286098.1 metallopeptidase family protein [Verrucomicrobiota bacterium]MCG2661655.1 metallopeptidase family protein [Kiritimatiellia bacterium]